MNSKLPDYSQPAQISDYFSYAWLIYIEFGFSQRYAVKSRPNGLCCHFLKSFLYRPTQASQLEYRVELGSPWHKKAT
jgi:hypothetical protein